MTIRTKLIIWFLLISLVSAAVVHLVDVYNMQVRIKESIGLSLQGMAREKADAIARVVKARIDEAEILAFQPWLRTAVRAANAAYLRQDAREIMTHIARIDQDWVASKGNTRVAVDLQGNDFSRQLRNYRDRDAAKYGEIFVTDRWGTAIAMTGTLSDYHQADEEWWTGGYHEGKGEVFLDDRGYDDTAKAVVIGVVVPIVDEGEVVGILKINYRIKAILAIVAPPGGGAPHRVFLARSEGTILQDARESGNAALLPAYRKLLANRVDGWIQSENEDVKSILAYAAVDIAVSARVPQPGAIKGVSGEHWEPVGWGIFVETSQDWAFSTLRESRVDVVRVGVVVLLIVAVLALWIARRISRPVQALQRGMEMVRGGTLNYRVSTTAKDEIGELSRTFDRMSAKLQAATEARDRVERTLETRTADLAVAGVDPP